MNAASHIWVLNEFLRSYQDFARRGKQNQILSFRHCNLPCDSENEDCPNNDAKLSKFQALEFTFIPYATQLSEMKRLLHCSYEATGIITKKNGNLPLFLPQKVCVNTKKTEQKKKRNLVFFKFSSLLLQCQFQGHTRPFLTCFSSQDRSKQRSRSELGLTIQDFHTATNLQSTPFEGNIILAPRGQLYY